MLDYKHSNLPTLLKQLADARHRQLLLVTGRQAWCYQQSEQLLTQSSDCLVLSNNQLLSQAIWPDHLHQILGQEFDHLIYDGFSGILPNKIAAAAGTVKAGGLFVLLLPELSELDHWIDSAIQRWSSEGYTPTHSYFLNRWRQLWQRQPAWQISEKHESSLPKNYHPSGPTTCGIEAQQHVLSRITSALINNHTPILLSADRGRGKSALLGLLAAKLPEQPFVICSRHFHALHSCFAMRANTLNQPVKHNSKTLANLSYLAPDALLQQAPSLDSNTILLIDEAATLPVPFLIQVAQLGFRCVFSSTLVGYEGNGRGYTLRFKRHLATHYPKHLDFTLTSPIRYASNDPLEQQIRRLFALECKIKPPTSSYQYSMRAITQAELATNNTLLEQVFSLLVLAHYQTSVDDLRQLLDAPDLYLYGTFCDDQLVAICLAVLEGGMPDPLAQDIINGKRRPAGHLMSQQLATTYGDRHFVSAHHARIIRIAVHPDMQRRGIGSQLLSAVENSLPRHISAVGTSFGLTTELLTFWHQQGYQPLKIGFKQDKASGEYALIALKPRKAPISASYQALFKQGFVYQLRTTYQHLDTSTVTAVLATLQSQQVSSEQLSYLHFLSQSTPNEQQICPFLWQLVTLQPKLVKSLTNISSELIIRLVLQQHATQVVQQMLGLSGKKALVIKLREALQQVYEYFRH
ncbi:tRNA(Met) cytidine acetyltransferase [Pseudoalteromonas sp. J010]|uniref:GNAT family N-acetyltransferase n=1 Tax=Pseudoalteromonas sp. J010 TaxID=998465 RepID=UPI000F64E07A|nr:GNAT family N-acetyltransferase [Pseudoalteromonas sp. J010]RRS09737.1 tRNA(Met) cytidine acetyltransferase [Pseudoalteromonas sp. J010]